MRYVFAFLTLALPVSPLCAQQAPPLQETRVYEIRDNFVAAAVVYARCGANDPDLKLQFGLNLGVIMMKAAMQAQEERPGEPDEVSAKAVEDRLTAMAALTKERLDAAGCDSDYARKLLKMYESYANWDAYGLPEK
jgi:hypothetical protein